MIDERDLISHEAGHAIGLLIGGHGVAEVRVDHAVHGELGRTTADFSNSSADFGCLIACLMGPLSEGQPPPAWPLRRDAPDGPSGKDERNMAALIEHLDLSESDYEAAVVFANHIRNDPDVKGYHALLCEALSRVPVINGDQLRELLGQAFFDRFQPEREDTRAAA